MDEIFSTYRQVMDILDEKVQGFHEEFQEHLQCKKGCSSCCENARFKIRYIEAVALMDGYAGLPEETRREILTNLRNPPEARKTHCPLLIDGACSIYEHRPALCRAYGIIIQLGDKMATCPLNFTEVAEDMPLKKLDLMPFYDLLDELSERLWKDYGTSSPEGSAAPSFTIREFLDAALP